MHELAEISDKITVTHTQHSYSTTAVSGPGSAGEESIRPHPLHETTPPYQLLSLVSSCVAQAASVLVLFIRDLRPSATSLVSSPLLLISGPNAAPNAVHKSLHEAYTG